MAPSTRPPTACSSASLPHPAHLPAGRLDECVRQDARHPQRPVDATEHLLAMADDWQPRKVDLGVVNGRCFTFSSGLGLDASVVAARGLKPAPEGPLRRLFLHLGRREHLHAPLHAAPTTPASTRRRRAGSRASPRSSRTARPSPTSRTVRSRSPRRRRSTRERSQPVSCTARARSTCRSSPGARSRGARSWPATATSRPSPGLAELTRRSPPTASHCRYRSTATISGRGRRARSYSIRPLAL